MGSRCWDWLTHIWWSRNKYNFILFQFIWLKFVPVSQRKHIYFLIKHFSGKPTFGCRFMNSMLTFEWCPVVLWPSQDVPILFVLLLQPVDERLEIFHQRLDWHFGLASNQSHGFRPGFTEAHLHHITETRGDKNDKKTSLLVVLVKTVNSLSLSSVIHWPQEFPCFFGLVDVTVVERCWLTGGITQGLVELELDYKTHKVPIGAKPNIQSIQRLLCNSIDIFTLMIYCIIIYTWHRAH